MIREPEAARQSELRTFVFFGDCERSVVIADTAILVSNANTRYVHEAHIVVGQTLCDLVKRCLFGGRISQMGRKP